MADLLESMRPHPFNRRPYSSRSESVPESFREEVGIARPPRREVVVVLDEECRAIAGRRIARAGEHQHAVTDGADRPAERPVFGDLPAEQLTAQVLTHSGRVSTR